MNFQKSLPKLLLGPLRNRSIATNSSSTKVWCCGLILNRFKLVDHCLKVPLPGRYELAGSQLSRHLQTVIDLLERVQNQPQHHTLVELLLVAIDPIPQWPQQHFRQRLLEIHGRSSTVQALACIQKISAAAEEMSAH